MGELQRTTTKLLANIKGMTPFRYHAFYIEILSMWLSKYVNNQNHNQAHNG